MGGAASRPIMIAPGCTFDPQRVPKANLEAIRETLLPENTLEVILFRATTGEVPTSRLR